MVEAGGHDGDSDGEAGKSRQFVNPESPRGPLTKEYTLNYRGLHIMI